jgi:hypothetical protein
VSPGTVPIERARIRPHVGWKVLRRDAEPFIPSGLGPLVERVPCRRVEHIRVGRGRARIRIRALAGAQRGGAVLVDELREASEHRQFHFAAARGGNSYAVLAGLSDLDPGRWGVDAVRDLSLGAGDIQPDAPLEQPDDLVGLEIDERVRVEMERTAVREQDLHAAGLRAQTIAGEQRHGGWRGLRAAVALEDSRPFDQRDVRRRIVGTFLRDGEPGTDQNPCEHKRWN